MKISNVLTSLPRETLALFVRARLMPPSTLVWYDLYAFFSTLPDTLPRMDRYAQAADAMGVTEDHARRVLNHLEHYL